MTIPSCLRFCLPGFAAAILLAGCTSHDIVTTASRPGKFRLFSCDQLDKRGIDLLKRERELQGLIQKAREAPGGELAVAMAYQNEFNINQGDLHEVELAGAEKKCQLKYRSVSERAVR